MIKQLNIIIGFTLLSASVMAAEKFRLSAAEWAQPKRAETIMQMPAIRKAINALNNANSHLAIHYPGGESGILWASELKGWLVSLGVDSTLIHMQPGSANADTLDLMITAQP